MSPRASALFTAPSACLLLAIAAVGCKTAPSTPDDAALTSSSQSTINSDTSLGGQPITVTVQKGIANLNGTVTNDAQKTLAARDVAGVRGVREVNNNLSVAAAPQVSSNTTTPAYAPILPAPVITTMPVQPVRKTTPTIPARRLPVQPEPDSYRPVTRYPDNNNPQRPALIERNQPPAQTFTAPPVPVQPAFRSVNVPSGTTIPVRVTQTLDSATTQQGDTFSGTVTSDVVVDGAVVIPVGSTVSGQVDTVHEAGHFKGSSLLTVSLSGLTRKGERMPISTDPYSVQGKGRGVNTAEKTGGGAAVGAILGGIFGGGKGAAIGAAAGGGVGAGSNAVTRGQQVQIASETVIRFHLATPVTVRARTDQAPRNGALQPRDNN